MLKKLTFSHSLLEENNPKDNKVRKSAARKEHKTGADFIQLIKSWEDIVGKGLSEITLPLRISYKTLYIVTTHSSYSQQLSFAAPQILEKILQFHPSFQGHIKQIRFQVSPNFFLQKIKDREKSVKRKQQDVLPHRFSPEFRSLKDQAESIYQDIEDPELKEQLVSLYIQSVFSKK